jgi:hypothetical protein
MILVVFCDRGSVEEQGEIGRQTSLSQMVLDSGMEWKCEDTHE